MANLDIAPGFTGVAVVTPGQAGPYTGAFPDSLMNPDHKLFSPRTGVAWRPSKKSSTVIRAGYGLFFVGSIYYQFPVAAGLAAALRHHGLGHHQSRPRPHPRRTASPPRPSQNVTNTYAVDKNYRVPYVQNWNFSVQHSFKHGILSCRPATSATRARASICSSCPTAPRPARRSPPSSAA